MNKVMRRSFLATAGGTLLATTLGHGSGTGITPVPAALGTKVPAGDPRDLPSRDRRLEMRALGTPRIPAQFDSLPKWQARSRRLREQILSAAGLWPMLDKAPLRAHTFDRVDGIRVLY